MKYASGKIPEAKKGNDNSCLCFVPCGLNFVLRYRTDVRIMLTPPSLPACDVLMLYIKAHPHARVHCRGSGGGNVASEGVEREDFSEPLQPFDARTEDLQVRHKGGLAKIVSFSRCGNRNLDRLCHRT